MLCFFFKDLEAIREIYKEQHTESIVRYKDRVDDLVNREAKIQFGLEEKRNFKSELQAILELIALINAKNDLKKKRFAAAPSFSLHSCFYGYNKQRDDSKIDINSGYARM